MREDIINYISEEVEFRCKQHSNSFGIGCFYHIKAVVNNAESLADRYNADKEVVIIAAWLHDIASVTDYRLYEEHHIHGARIADEILKELNYQTDKIEIVKQCIKNHRGSVLSEKQTKEEVCVADADAISHFDKVPSLLYLAYVKKNLEFSEGVEFVRNKLKRSFEKLSDESKEFYKDKYESVMKLLDD